MKHRIAILIPYFGDWPPWINFFVESCRSNRTIDWFLFSDAAPPENRAPNVRHLRTTFEDYKALVSDALSQRIAAETPYKLCDLKPALPHIHADVVAGYDFVGFGDLDVIYGDIRAFYNEETLDRYDMLSTHSDRVSGHFCLVRNREDVVASFRRIPGWDRGLRNPEYVDLDERGFFNLFRGRKANLLDRLRPPNVRCLFRETYSTPAVSNDMRWYWEGGRLTNEHYPHHPFMYLHFMSWHSNRWYASQAHVTPGTEPPWNRIAEIVQIDWRDARTGGFMISPAGIQSIERRTYP